MKKALILLIIILIKFNAYSQNIIFSDLSLKSFLINENCVDIDNDNNPDISADLNNDSEIQISEAESLTNLIFYIFQNNYAVESIQDLGHFSNIEKLTVLYFHDLEEISLLGLNNLTDLWIGSCFNLKHIDLSDMQHLVNLRIEDIYSLDYLNLQNNNFPSGVFSLFYTENIQYACVDDINEEYDEVSYHMAQDVFPSIDCALGIEGYSTESQIEIFPNPTSDLFRIKGNGIENAKISIMDIRGRNVANYNKGFDIIDISSLSPGVYYVKIFMPNNFITKKIIKD